MLRNAASRAKLPHVKLPHSAYVFKTGTVVVIVRPAPSDLDIDLDLKQKTTNGKKRSAPSDSMEVPPVDAKYTFVVDTSGSMSQIDSLYGKSRLHNVADAIDKFPLTNYNAYYFNTELHSFPSHEDLVEVVRKFQPGYCTEITDSLMQLDPAIIKGTIGVILTDGDDERFTRLIDPSAIKKDDDAKHFKALRARLSLFDAIEFIGIGKTIDDDMLFWAKNIHECPDRVTATHPVTDQIQNVANGIVSRVANEIGRETIYIQYEDQINERHMVIYYKDRPTFIAFHIDGVHSATFAKHITINEEKLPFNTTFDDKETLITAILKMCNDTDDNDVINECLDMLDELFGENRESEEYYAVFDKIADKAYAFVRGGAASCRSMSIDSQSQSYGASTSYSLCSSSDYRSLSGRTGSMTSRVLEMLGELSAQTGSDQDSQLY